MRTFKSYTIDEFNYFLSKANIERNINHVQIHHTWKPTKSMYNNAKEKESIIRGIWEHHTKVRNWSDIGQHFTISPDGLIWDGRSLERTPAGIEGHNTGGIMIEIIGNFDVGYDTLENIQLYTVTKAVALILHKFKLSLDNIVFHREFSPKTCPGSSIDKNVFVKLVDNILKTEINTFDKKAGIRYLAKQGIIQNPELWCRDDKIDEPMPTWAITTILARIYKEVKNNETTTTNME